jgi:hypothetical protein
MCEHRLFYRRINRNDLKTNDVIHWNAFKPRGNEDGLQNGPSVNWDELCPPMRALSDECETNERHLIAFRECIITPPATIENKDEKDPSHFFLLHYPADRSDFREWAAELARRSSVKIRCENRNPLEIPDNPPIDCDR